DVGVSEEEIRMMVDVGSEKGVIDTIEKDMIQNVFEFDSTTVSEFATHRKDMIVLLMEESVEEWEKVIHESRHTFYPICNKNVDDIVGILDIKDYFRLTDKNREDVLKSAVKSAYFIPKSVCANVVFKQMKKNHNHIAVVVDEYGGVEGIVTMNDLLEQIVGELEDECSQEPTSVEIDNNIAN
ncbi:MAG: CBS domain-containing protein, partial [Clostridia bacterium]